MLPQNIKLLRTQNGLTQKDLSQKLHVTSQAVSRWENGDVEPSVSTIGEMAKIFGVTTDEIIGGPENKPKTEIITKAEKEYVVKENKPVLAVCEKCNKPIFDGSDIVRKIVHHGRLSSTTHIYCKDCEEKRKIKALHSAIDTGLAQRRNSFIFSSIYAVIALIIGLSITISQKLGAGYIAGSIILPILIFTFSSCLYLKNNFIEDAFLNVASFGIKLPGVVFHFSLDGLAFFIVVKIFLWFIGILISICATILALTICLPLSAITYPFALIKNFKNPELSDELYTPETINSNSKSDEDEAEENENETDSEANEESNSSDSNQNDAIK